MRDQRLDRRAPLALPDCNHGDRLRTPQPPSPGPATGGHPGSLAASRWPCCRSDHSASPLGPPTHSSPPLLPQTSQLCPGTPPTLLALGTRASCGPSLCGPVGCEALFPRKQHLRVRSLRWVQDRPGGSGSSNGPSRERGYELRGGS